MCVRTKGVPEPTASISSVEAAGQVYNQTDQFVYLGGTSTTMNADLSIEFDRRML